MTKIIKLNSNNYICEDDNLLKIYNHLIVGSKTLLESPMKAGKTYTASELFKLRQNCIKVLLVPRNSLGEGVECRFAKEHKVKMLFEGNNISSEELKDCVIITSPESFLKKVIPRVKELNLDKEMFTIYDERHLAIDNSSYRKSLYDALNVEKELKDFKTKFTLLGLTATPGILTEFVKFDSFITVNIKNSFKPTNIIGITEVNQSIDEIFIASVILKTATNNPTSRITIRLNDKKMIKKVADLIEQKTGIKPLTGTSDKTEEVSEIIKNGGTLDTSISFFTSYTEVGIEFNNYKDMILLDFEGLNNSSINHNSIIQNMGRYRNGLKTCLIYIEKSRESLKPNITRMIKKEKEYVKRAIQLSQELDRPNEYTYLSEDSKTIEIAPDVEYKIMKEVAETYTKNLIRNAKDLKRELKKVNTLNVSSIKIVKANYDDMLPYFSKYKEQKKINNKLVKEKKETLKNELTNLIENMTSENAFKSFYQKDLVFDPNMKRCIKILEELEVYDEVKSCYKSLYECFKSEKTQLTDKQYFELSLDYKRTFEKIIAIKNNERRNAYKKGKHFIIRDDEKDKFNQQNHIMNVIEEITGKKSRFKVSKKLMNAILEKCHYESIKGTKKDPYKKLIEVLKCYYNINTDYCNSQKTKYKQIF